MSITIFNPQNKKCPNNARVLMTYLLPEDILEAGDTLTIGGYGDNGRNAAY